MYSQTVHATTTTLATREVDAPAAEAAGGTARFDATGVTEDMPTWSELVAEHGDRVYRLAYRLCGNTHDAEDIT